MYPAGGGAVEFALDHPDAVTAVVLDPRRQGVLTVDNDGMLRVWGWGDRSLHGPTGTVFSMNYSRASGVLAAGSGDGRVYLYDDDRLLSSDVTARAPDDTYSGAASISADGRLVAAGSANGRVEVWDVSGATAPKFLSLAPGVETGDARVVESVAFSPDSAVLAAGGDDHRVRVWDVSHPSRPRVLAVLSGPDNYVYSVAVSRDGRYLAAASADDHAYLWRLDPAGPHLVARIGGFDSYTYSVAFSPTADVLAIGGHDSFVKLVHYGGRRSCVPPTIMISGARAASTICRDHDACSPTGVIHCRPPTSGLFAVP